MVLLAMVSFVPRRALIASKEACRLPYAKATFCRVATDSCLRRGVVQSEHRFNHLFGGAHSPRVVQTSRCDTTTRDKRCYF